jgi:hypothetical protein
MGKWQKMIDEGKKIKTFERHTGTRKMALMETENQQRGVQEGWPIIMKSAGTSVKGRMPEYTLRPPPCAAITERADPILVAQGWVGDKPCLVTISMGAYVTVTGLTSLPDGLKDS